MPTNPIEGGCHCGAVRYRLDGPVTHSMICHCRTCQKVSGAPVLAWMTVPDTGFTLTHGKLTSYASTPPVTRGFCGQCGTQLTYRHEREPGMLDVTTASLDHPEDFPAKYHSWLAHNIPWVEFGDGLERHEGSRTDG